MSEPSRRRNNEYENNNKSYSGENAEEERIRMRLQLVQCYEKIKKLDEENERLINEIQEYNDNGESLVQEHQASLTKIKSQEQKIARLQNEIQESNKNLNHFKSLYNKLHDDYEDLTDENNARQNEKKENQKLQNEIQLKEQKIDHLQQSLNLKESEVHKFKEKYNELLIEIKTSKNEITSKEQIINQLQQSLNLKENETNDINQYMSMSHKYKEKCTELSTKNKALKNNIKEREQVIEQLREKSNSQEQKIDKLQHSLTLKENETQIIEKEKGELINKLKSQLENLVQKIALLEDEAQSAIGIATNLNCDDQNYSVKLNKDILALHNNLENYVTNLKSKIDVNIDETNNLLRKYGCQAEIFDKESNRPLIKAVLQRHVLEVILEQANLYFSHTSESEMHLESNIVNQTKVLTNSIKRFYNNRLGEDETIRLTPIKLRQQVYTALGTRGFNDFKIPDNESSKHNFVLIASNQINDMMNKLRVIKDIEKREYVNALAEGLVRNVVKIFYFRLFIQEPTSQYHWFNNNEKINKVYMKGNWDEGDVENMAVEICSFPLIFKSSSPDDFKVFTSAKVFPRHAKQDSADPTERLMDIVREPKCSPNNDSTPNMYTDEQADSDDSLGENATG